METIYVCNKTFGPTQDKKGQANKLLIKLSYPVMGNLVVIFHTQSVKLICLQGILSHKDKLKIEFFNLYQ